MTSPLESPAAEPNAGMPIQSTGAQYPLNPTVAPVLADWPQGTFVLSHGDATVKALTAGRRITGVLGKATRFQLGLQHDTGKVQGSYFYEKYGKPIVLQGTAMVQCATDRNEGEQVTARLSLKRSPPVGLGNGGVRMAVRKSAAAATGGYERRRDGTGLRCACLRRIQCSPARLVGGLMSPLKRRIWIGTPK